MSDLADQVRRLSPSPGDLFLLRVPRERLEQIGAGSVESLTKIADDYECRFLVMDPETQVEQLPREVMERIGYWVVEEVPPLGECTLRVAVRLPREAEIGHAGLVGRIAKALAEEGVLCSGISGYPDLEGRVTQLRKELDSARAEVRRLGG